MKLGLCIPLRRYATPDFIRTLGTVSERLGFDSLWVGEHVVMFDDHKSDYPLTGEVMPGDPRDNIEIDLFTSLAYLAAVTSRIRLGSYVAILPQRNPVYTAKEAANIDWLSNGRFDFGIGLGWSVQEFEACAAPFEKRGARCRSYLEVIKVFGVILYLNMKMNSTSWMSVFSTLNRTAASSTDLLCGAE